MKRLFVEFSEETTAHAFRQIFDEQRKICVRAIWSLMLLGGLSAFTFQVIYLVGNFLSYPTSVNTYLNFDTLNFPSVTFCNNNPLKVHYLEGTEVFDYLTVYRELTTTSNASAILQKYCNFSRPLQAPHNESNLSNGTMLASGLSKGTMLASGGFCSELQELYAADNNMNFANSMYLKLQMKAWADLAMLVSMNSSAYIGAMYHISDLLMSCVYNMVTCTVDQFTFVPNAYFGACFTFNSNYTYKVSRSGPMYGLRLLLDLQTDQYLTCVDSFGAKVVIHSNTQEPLPEVDSYSLSANFRTSLALTMSTAEKLPAPYGACKYTTIEVERCMILCQSQAAAKNCSCTMASMSPDDKPCTTVQDAICHTGFKDSLTKNNYLTMDYCNCTESCSVTNFQATLSQSVFRMPSTISFNRSHHEPPKDVAEFEVFYQQLNFKTFEQESTYSLASLFSDFGGSIGLWLGASVITIGEFVGLFLSICFYGCGLTKRNIEKIQSKANDEEVNQFKSPSTVLYSKDERAIATAMPRVA